MDTCQICKHDFGTLRFKTERIKICARCVNTLNDFNEPAIQARMRIREMLARGMERNALRDLASEVEWKRRKALRTLSHLADEAELAVDGWITKLLADKRNSTKDFKMLRAERRGLLRMTGGNPYTYPSDWPEQARRIRAADKQCADCGDTTSVQDVHHIVHLSKFGTNRQENLVRLCRPCHQKLHGFDFDPPESGDPEQYSPIQFQRKEPENFNMQQPRVRSEDPHASDHSDAYARALAELEDWEDAQPALADEPKFKPSAERDSQVPVPSPSFSTESGAKAHPPSGSFSPAKLVGALAVLYVVAFILYSANQSSESQKVSNTETGVAVEPRTNSSQIDEFLNEKPRGDNRGLPEQRPPVSVIPVTVPDGTRLLVESDTVISEADAYDAAIRVWRMNAPLPGQSRRIDGLTVRAP